MIDDAPTQQLRLGSAATTFARAPFPTAGPAPRGPWAPGPVMAPPPMYHPGPVPPGSPVAPRPRWPWVVGAVGVLVVALGLFATVLAPSTTVSGTVTYYSSSYLAIGTSCEGTGSFNFLTPGGSVSVYDEAGALVGTGYLGSSTVSSTGSSYSGYGTACVFTYSVSDVASSDFYRVKVGSSSSDDGVAFSADDIDGNADIRFGRY